MPRLPENYWLLGRNLPDLLAPSTSGKAELASDDILTRKSHLNKTLVRGDPYPNHPGADFPKQDRWDFNRPPARDYLSVKSYFDEETPLCNIESYIYHKEDLISLKPGRENAWLDVAVEKVLQKLPYKLIRVIATLQI